MPTPDGVQKAEMEARYYQWPESSPAIEPPMRPRFMLWEDRYGKYVENAELQQQKVAPGVNLSTRLQ